MIVVLYGRPRETLRSTASRRDAVSIGSDPKGDVVLADPSVEPLHARLMQEGDRWVLATAAPLHINDEQVTGRFFIGVEDEIRIGGFVLHVRPVVVDARERELIEAASKDDDARLIYADWLEEHGQWDRAELLRLQHEARALDPMGPHFQSLATRIRKLAPALDLAWRMAVSRDNVEGCRSVTREFTCTMNWSGLEPTAEPNVRSCRGCRQQVFYCATEDEAAHHAREGHCIVIDLGANRGGLLGEARRTAERDRELERRPPAMPGMYMPPTVTFQPPGRRCDVCQTLVPTRNRFCAHCGAPIT